MVPPFYPRSTGFDVRVWFQVLCDVVRFRFILSTDGSIAAVSDYFDFVVLVFQPRLSAVGEIQSQLRLHKTENAIPVHASYTAER